MIQLPVRQKAAASIAAFCLIVTMRVLTAQVAPPDVTISPKPVGSGARALGQAAFIGVADDATAAAWNPAGLVRLERPELSVVGAGLYSHNDYEPASSSVNVIEGSWGEAELNYLSLVWPLRIGRHNLVLSAAHRQVFDFGLKLTFSEVVQGQSTTIPVKVDIDSRGAVYASGPAAAFSLTPSLSAGVTLNFYHDSMLRTNTWEVDTTARAPGMAFDNEETFDGFFAWNVTVGVMWEMWRRNERRLALGAVVHTPYTADVTRTSRTRISGSAPSKVRQEFELDFPLSVGIGLDYRFSDDWSVAADVQWTQWSEFVQEDGRGRKSSPIGGGRAGDVADTVAVRLGTEYLLRLRHGFIPLRGGVFYEPRPALDDALDIFGVSLGTGWTTSRLSFDVAYQFRYGESAGGRNLGVPSVRYRVREHWFVASVIVYF